MLVKSHIRHVGLFLPLGGNTVFRRLFGRKSAPLTGAPPVRRLKTYSAQSGYVYQYSYEGQRPFQRAGEDGAEFVFQISADRKSWHATSVFVPEHALRGWEQAHGRTLSSTERYAVCKLALFQAFDDRPKPELMKDPIQVRAADVDGIIETLGL